MPSKLPSPASSGEEDEMIIRVKSIPTLGQLYRSSELSAPAAAARKYPPKAAYLDRVSLFQGDITELQVDSIVNAANKSLLGGGGGRTLNGCETGDAKITKGYHLPSKHIIHTVGPVYSSSDKENRAGQLASCYKTSLQVAIANSLKHIAFPSISTGIYGYPIEDATHIALDEVRRFLDTEPGDQVRAHFPKLSKLATLRPSRI
ncbi:hypothetical protein HWV62_43365 [Athelia sp. TMB]|nr:hypothetical protein HWV62_43365 [Athelia sp. TMB]